MAPRDSECRISAEPLGSTYGRVLAIPLYDLRVPQIGKFKRARAVTVDSLITPADRDAIEQTVSSAYRRLGVEDRFDCALHEEGHRLLWAPAESFLERHLLAEH